MFKRITLEIIVFVTGAVVMILELTGTRIIAPYAGTSIIVWTSLIGVILGFLSIGYFLGGKFADKGASFKKLGDILIVSAVLTVFINILRPFALVLTEGLFRDARSGSVFLAILLFGPVSLVLGMVPTYAVRLKIKSLKNSGETVGRLYALSTIGSIIGTFLGGFLLIAILGNRNIIFALSIVLAIASIISYSKGLKKNSLFLIYVIAGILSLNFSDYSWYKDKKIILDTDSLYSRIIVAQIKEPSSGKLLLALFTGRFFYSSGGYQSAVYLEEEDNLPAGYLKFFRLGKYYNPDIKNALLIGGGAYTFPRDFIKRNPNSRMDVVELDPKLTDIAEKYFFLKDDERIRIVHSDGRTYLRNNVDKYDAIYMDAYSDFSFPWHLITYEASIKIYDSLETNGVFIINLISSIDGDSGKTFRSIHRTLDEIFPNVYVYAVSNPNDGSIVQNLVLLALKEEDNDANINISAEYSEYSIYSDHLLKKEIDKDVPVITDDYAPLEYYYLLMSRKILNARK